MIMQIIDISIIMEELQLLATLTHIELKQGICMKEVKLMEKDEKGTDNDWQEIERMEDD